MYYDEGIPASLLNRLAGAVNWVELTLVICFFLVVLFRPRQIRSPSLFFWAILTLAGSFVGPPLYNALLLLLGSTLGSSAGQEEGRMIFVVGTLIPPLCLAISIALGGISLLPRRTSPTGPGIVTAHPLD